MTPLQLGAVVSTVANGGTLYYLQYPRTAEERQNFTPRIKRSLNIGSLLQDVRDGMLAAVLYGTARLSYISNDEQALGKTGTCSDSSSRIRTLIAGSRTCMRRSKAERTGRCRPAGATFRRKTEQGAHSRLRPSKIKLSRELRLRC